MARPMIISKVPLRVSFIGGGSDYPEWFRKNQGAVLGATIDKSVFVTLAELSKFSKEKFRFTYRVTESVNSVDEFKHPVVREVLKRHFTGDFFQGLNLGTFADIPGHSGMGSSSSFSVGLLHALEEFKNPGTVSKEYLAASAIRIEREILGEKGGWQDQYHAAFGGLRLYEFGPEGVTVGPQLLDQNGLSDLSKYFVLVKAGKERDSQVSASRTSQHFALPTFQKALRKQVELTKDLATSLQGQAPEFFARSLFEAVRQSSEWKSSLGDSVVPKEVNDVGLIGEALGAKCHKLLGAGGSGYLLFGADPEVIKVIKSHFYSEHLGFEFSGLGSQVFRI